MGKSMLSASLWVVTAQLISMLALLLGTRLITELLEPADYGVVSLIVGGSALFINIFFNPIKQYLERFYSSAKKSGEQGELLVQLKKINRNIVTYFVISAILASLIAYVFLHDYWILIAAGAFLVISYQGRDYEISYYLASLQYQIASGLSIADAILRQVCAITCLYIAGAHPESVILGYGVAAVGMAGVARLKRNNDILPSSVRSETFDANHAAIKNYAIPLSIFALFTWISATADRYFISAILDLSSVGIYAVAYAIMYQIYWNGHVVLIKIFRPSFFMCIENNDLGMAKAIFKKWALTAAIAMTIGNFSFAIFSEQFVSILFAKSYSDSAKIMPFMAIAFTINVGTGILQQLAFAAKNSLIVTKVRAIGAIAALIISPLFIYYFGFIGIGYSMIIYFSLEFLVMLFTLKKNSMVLWKAR